MTRGWVPRADSLLGQLHAPLYMRWQAWLSLFALVGLFQAPLASPHIGWSWLAPTLLAVPVCVYLYARVYLGPLARLEWHAAGIAATGLALWFYNPFGFLLLALAGLLLGFSPSWRRWLCGVACLSVVAAAKVMLFGDPPKSALAVSLAGGLGGFGNLLYVRTLRQDGALRLSQDETRRLATLAERERIGRDLHDLLGHTLSLVALKSELARRLALAEPARAQREMAEVERVARHALGQVRAAVSGMRCSDLAAELVSARLMLEACGVAFEGSLPEGVRLPETIEASLALVLREAVTNIHRHARASQATLSVRLGENVLDMRIGDNGRGGVAAHGNGISGMRERVRAIGGTLQIDSPARRGTLLRVRVPLAVQSAVVTTPPTAASGAPLDLGSAA